jgi:tRNA threonylcarbamoyladenosine biosynthesis protein TsaB
VLALADARMGQCYHAWFRCCGGRIEALAEAGVDAPEALSPPVGVGPWHVIGQGMEALWPSLPEPVRAGALEVVLDATIQARDLLQLARRALAEGRTVPPWEAAPYYVRDKVALTAEEQAALRQRRMQAP